MSEPRSSTPHRRLSRELGHESPAKALASHAYWAGLAVAYRAIRLRSAARFAAGCAREDFDRYRQLSGEHAT